MSENPSRSERPGPRRYLLETYGCQMNEYDSSLVAGLLEERGYAPTTRAEEADLILINTCSVREKAEETALDKLTSLAHLRRRDDSVHLGVLGCMAENRGEAVRDRVPEVDILLGPDHYHRLGEVLDRAEGRAPVRALGPDRSQTYEGLFPAAPAGVSAFVAIQRGCDKKCSYCIVPTTRGPERSRPAEDVVREVEHLVARGAVEITLLGQTVNAWRHGGTSFADLLRQLGRVEGIRRVRFTSPHPRHFTEAVCQALAETPAACPHVHLPLQSGSSRVLRAMRRQYSRDQYLSIVERLRRHLPDVAITTDIIAGYPGETEAEHRETLSLMDEVVFDAAFMFAYSPRPGTPAADEPEFLTAEAKQARLQEIIDRQHAHTRCRLDARVGLVEEVLLEGASRRDPGEWIGKTPHFRKVVLRPGEAARPGDLVRVRIEARRGQVLRGIPV